MYKVGLENRYNQNIGGLYSTINTLLGIIKTYTKKLESKFNVLLPVYINVISEHHKSKYHKGLLKEYK